LRVSRAHTGETLRLVFEVEDTGTGIIPRDMDTLFDPFVRSEKRHAKEQGTGLGLPISQRYVQMLGGRIDVQSTVGQGSVFSFRIPVVMGRRPDRHRAPERQVIGLAPDQPEYRVLVVDDNAESRILIERLLSPLGFEVWSTTSGIEGMRTAHEWEPHVILMDMRMPNMDGYEAARRIRSTSKGQRVVIIGFTASVLEQERARMIAVGCNDILRKPFRANELYELLVRHLGVQFAYTQAEVDMSITDTNEIVRIQNLNAAMLAELPIAWRAELRQASVEGDVERVRQLINLVRDDHDEIADHLTTIAADFEFDRILELLE
jgi:CheY-like chemotaxis protein